ncbi:MAG: hypothetical protein ABL958_14675 [Bdellovibrionia bacterium]
MKAFVLLALGLMCVSAQAELLVVTMPLTGNNGHLSKFNPAETFESGGLLVRTDDGQNECLITSKVLRANNSSAVDFMKHLKELSASKDQYLLSCYTESSIVTQVVITKSK